MPVTNASLRTPFIPGWPIPATHPPLGGIAAGHVVGGNHVDASVGGDVTIIEHHGEAFSRHGGRLAAGYRGATVNTEAVGGSVRSRVRGGEVQVPVVSGIIE